MPDLLPRDYDYTEAAEKQGRLPARKGNERRVSYALIPQHIVVEMSPDRALRFDFRYPIQEAAGEVRRLRQGQADVVAGEHTNKLLKIQIPQWDPGILSTLLHDIATDVRRMGQTFELPAVSENYAIASRFLRDVGPQITSDVCEALQEEQYQSWGKA